MNNYPNLSTAELSILVMQMNERLYDEVYGEIPEIINGVILSEYLKKDPVFIGVVNARKSIKGSTLN